MKRIIKVLFYLLIPLSVSGQMTPVTSQYVLNPLAINPAFAGNRGVMNIAAFYRKQWIGISGAPETLSLSLDAPFNEDKVGLGLIISNNKIGVTKETRLNSNYAYRIKMDKGVLSFGLGAGILATNTAWSDLVVLDPDDEYFLIDSRVFIVPNFSFGSYYSSDDFFAGFSIPKLLSYNYDFDKSKYAVKADLSDYYYLLNTGYLFDLSSKLKFIPSVLMAYFPGNIFQFDLNGHFRFYDHLWTGISYRSNRSVAGMFQFGVSDQLKFAYTYDFDFNKLRTFSSGSHEIMLRYEFRYKVDAVSPLNF